MALCLRVPTQLPHKLKFQYQCCRYLTWNKIQTIKKKAQEKFSFFGSPLKGSKDVRGTPKNLNSLEEYFDKLGRSLSEPYLNLLKDLSQDIPEPPTFWELNSGWTRYTPSGASPVFHPKEDALVFDVEVCVQEGFYPTLATAVSQKAWYLWVSPRLIRRHEKQSNIVTTGDLIPLGFSDKPRIVVGHFISYDRARIKESYSTTGSGLRYFDTLSAHTCVSAVTNMQRNLMFSSSYNNERWHQLTSLNGLEKISEFYCGISLNKSTRDVFVKGTLEDIYKNFQTLSSYCAEDVIATHKVFCKLLPLFLDRQPHPVSLAGMLELSTPFLPVKKTWESSVEKVKSQACELKEGQFKLMKTRADKCLSLNEQGKYRFDPWMWDLDWKPQRYKSQIYPSWYKAFCMGCAKSLDDSDGSSVVYAGLTVPKILRLRCGPYPLHYIHRLGWGVIVPSDQFIGNVKTYLEDDIAHFPIKQIQELCSSAMEAVNPPKVPSMSLISEMVENDLYWRESFASSNSGPSSSEESPSNDTVQELLIADRCVFRRLMNVSGIRPVRNPLGLSMSKSVTSFNSAIPEGETFLDIRENIVPWLIHGHRWKTLTAVWLQSGSSGVVIPMIEVCADYFRLPRERALSSLIAVEDDQLGAELLKSIHAPRGHLFMTVTIDNLDLWLAAIFSDKVGKTLGSTKFSAYLMSGVLFEEMASALKVSPEEAECLCHYVVAGADTYMLSKLIFQARVNISWDEAFQRACQCMNLLLEYKLLSSSPSDLWPDINSDEIRTPLLGARLSRPLEIEKQRVRFRAQWLINSSKVDFLHLLVACFREFHPSARLCFVHGENMSLYYSVKSYNQEQAEEVVSSAYQKVQSFCVSRLGFSPDSKTCGPPLKVTFSKGLRS